MEISKNIIRYIDYTLNRYPFPLPEEFEKKIYDAFVRKKGPYDFSEFITYMNANGLFSTKDYIKMSEFQFYMDLDTHEHIQWKGLHKKDYLSAAFTFAYRIISGFAKQYPEYILVALIQSQLVTQTAPEPICKTEPSSRISFYFYSPCADGSKDLYWYKNRPLYCKESMYWRFSTFDIPMLKWMIEKVQCERRSRKNIKKCEKAPGKIKILART